jgi:hypothetical protein
MPGARLPSPAPDRRPARTEVLARLHDHDGNCREQSYGRCSIADTLLVKKRSEKELLELQEPSARRMSAELRPACRRCMAAKGIFTAVTVLAWTDTNLCLRHQLWTGHGVTSIEDQAGIAGIPEIGQAQTRLSRLCRRRGPRDIWYSYETAEAVIDWSSREASSLTPRQERLRHLLPPGR